MEPNDRGRDRVLAVLSAVVLLADVASLMVVGVTAFFHVPIFRRIFTDMGAALPVLTTFFLDIPPAVYAALAVVLAVGLIVKEPLVRPVVRLVVNIAALPPIIFTAIALILALVVPLLSMMQAMGS
jgi:hypothetical protein